MSPWPLVHPLFVAPDLAQDRTRGREILEGGVSGSSAPPLTISRPVAVTRSRESVTLRSEEGGAVSHENGGTTECSRPDWGPSP
jgi:hypothetical protein